MPNLNYSIGHNGVTPHIHTPSNMNMNMNNVNFTGNSHEPHSGVTSPPK